MTSTTAATSAPMSYRIAIFPGRTIIKLLKIKYAHTCDRPNTASVWSGADKSFTPWPDEYTGTPHPDTGLDFSHQFTHPDNSILYT